MQLPTTLPEGDVAVHEVFADESAGYQPRHEVHGGNGPMASDGFVLGTPDHDVDDRVSLYGGSKRLVASRPRPRTRS